MVKTEDKIPKSKAKTVVKVACGNAPKKSPRTDEAKDKILTYMDRVMKEEGLEDVLKQDVAEACGYSSPGVHIFFYAWQELQKQGLVTKSGKKGCGCLTDLGKQSIPGGGVVVAAPKNNAEKREVLLAQLQRKLAKKAPADKIATIVQVLQDGMAHSLDELCEATGWKGLNTKSFGYTMSAMKKQGLADCQDKTYTLTDKWFPEGRPESS